MKFTKLLTGMFGAASIAFLLAACATPYKPPLPPPPTVTLSAPEDFYKIQPSAEQDKDILFQWQPHATYPIEREPLPEGWFDTNPKLPPIGSADGPRIRVYRVSYRLCLFESSRCDRSGPGNKIWFGPLTDPTRELLVRLPYAAWQGMSFYWAVEACTTFINTALPKENAFRGPFCEWSPTYVMHWLLPPPTGLRTSQNSRYASWHLEFHWDELTAGVFNYEICIAETQANLHSHCRGFNQPSAPNYEETESGSPYRRFDAPPPGAGSKGASATWKVAACAGPKLRVTDEEKCTYSAPQDFVWPD